MRCGLTQFLQTSVHTLPRLSTAGSPIHLLCYVCCLYTMAGDDLNNFEITAVTFAALSALYGSYYAFRAVFATDRVV